MGLTQETVARRASVHESSVGRIERGRRNATYVSLMRIACALEIEPRRLLEGPADASDLTSVDHVRPRRGALPAHPPPGRRRHLAIDEGLVGALGTRVHAHRKARGLSQQALAARAGVHWSFIGQVERGERNIRFRSLVQLAAGLGCSPAELFEDPGESAE